MTKRDQVYKCNICGNIVEMLHEGKGVMTCCEQPMLLLEENTVDAALEKHVPVVEKQGEGILVKVGSVSHPMEEKHYIEWIEVIKGNKIVRHHLNPGDKPESFFNINSDGATVREYCNLHGLWKG